jgi:hypothetical protein
VQGGIAYNDVMVAYGKWVADFAQQHQLTVADANTDFVKMLQRANLSDPGVAKDILGDHIHPSFGGALMIGEAVLKAWNARPLVASVTIHVDGSKAKITHTERRCSAATLSPVAGYVGRRPDHRSRHQ